MGTIFDKVIRPDMVPPRGPQTDARAVIEPQPCSFGLPLGHLQPFLTPDAFHPFVIHSPAFPLQHGRNASVSVSAKPFSKANNGLGERLFIISDSWVVPLGSPCLAQNPTGPALGYSELGHCLIHQSLAPGRA